MQINRYANDMKSQLLKTFLITIACTFTAQASLYKGLDAEGNVVYSDTPFENSKAITPPEISIVDAPKIPIKKAETKTEEEKPVVTKYTSLSITAPENDQVIWNEPQLIVSAKSKPAFSSSFIK